MTKPTPQITRLVDQLAILGHRSDTTTDQVLSLIDQLDRHVASLPDPELDPLNPLCGIGLLHKEQLIQEMILLATELCHEEAHHRLTIVEKSSLLSHVKVMRQLLGLKKNYAVIALHSHFPEAIRLLHKLQARHP